MTIERDLKRAVGILSKALNGLPGVTFHLTLEAWYSPHQINRVHSQVTLWFYNTFPMRVTGGRDFKLLAIHARDAAEHALLVMKRRKSCHREYHTYLVSEDNRQKHERVCLQKRRRS